MSFFLNGPLAVCSGRGEKVVKVGKPRPFAAILVLSDINVSTKMIYENFDVDLQLFKSLNDVQNNIFFFCS